MNHAEYARERDRILDEATIALLRASTPFSVVVMVDYEERRGLPAYDAVDDVYGDPRAFRTTCPFCGRAFVVQARNRRFCGDTCCKNAANRARGAAA